MRGPLKVGTGEGRGGFTASQPGNSVGRTLLPLYVERAEKRSLGLASTRLDLA